MFHLIRLPCHLVLLGLLVEIFFPLSITDIPSRILIVLCMCISLRYN